MSLPLLKEICSIPTAPFAEQRVLDWIDAFARKRAINLQADRFGNRLLTVGPRTGQRLIFVAHTDHPGLVADAMIDARTLRARFHGGVLSAYVKGARVRFHDTAGETTGVITEITRKSDRADYPAEVLVHVRRAIAAGSPGMFDQGIGRVTRGRFHSRVCDDLAGVAAILSAMEQLRRHRLDAPVGALLTRAEEEGFIGAIAAVKDGSLLRKSDRLISVECSAQQPYARQGDGVIVRVGDKTSIFHSGFTNWICSQCQALADRDARFKWQRALMPGGTCEATVFDASGFVAAAVCVPLGNYHNMDRERRRIGPEYVQLRDWQSEVKLFVELGRAAANIDLRFRELRSRLNKRFSAMKKFLSR